MDSEKDLKPSSGPYWQMMYIGIAGFFFWTLLIIQTPTIDKFFGGPEVVFYVTVAYGLTSNLFRVFYVWYAARTKTSQADQMRNLIVIGASLTAIFMIGYPIAMALLGTDNDERGFWTAIFLAGLVGLWTSLIVNAGFGLMSMAPAKSANFFLTGQTVIGVLTWPFLIILRLAVTRIANEVSDRTDLITAAISFSVAAAVVAGIIPLYLFKTRHHSVFAQASIHGSNWSDIKKVFRLIRTPALCAWICGVGTWCVFPGQVSRWHPSTKDTFDTPLYRSFLVYMFSIAEMIGRASPQLFPNMLKVSDLYLWIFTVGRCCVLIPIFIMTSKASTGFLANDWFRLVLVVLFGLVNGANFSTSNMIAPRRIQAGLKMHAGTLLSLVAINGKFTGTLLGLALKYI
jgi:hypothetical protein